MILLLAACLQPLTNNCTPTCNTTISRCCQYKQCSSRHPSDTAQAEAAYRGLVDIVFYGITLLQLLLRDQMVKVYQAQWNQLSNVWQPVQLPLGGLDAASKMQLPLSTCGVSTSADKRRCILDHTSYNKISGVAVAT